MPKRKSSKLAEEMPYVLMRADGSIRAHLMLTPTDAEKINLKRIQKGFLDGRWVHDPKCEPWEELKGLGNTRVPMELPVMLLSLMSPNIYPPQEEAVSTKTRGIWRKPIGDDD